MLLNVMQNIGLQCPTEEIQLSNGGGERVMIWNLEQNSLSAAIGVKILLGVRLELPFVTQIHQELLTVQRIAYEVFTTVFGNEPINDTQR